MSVMFVRAIFDYDAQEDTELTMVRATDSHSRLSGSSFFFGPSLRNASLRRAA
jgi:hypothetical protein